MKNHTENVHNSKHPVKPQVKKGPYRTRLDAVAAGKVDQDCIAAKSFTLIKHLPTHTYDYCMGSAPRLFSGDRIEARYHLLNDRVWSYPDYRT